MLIYHPGYDVNHCSYRILHMVYSVEQNAISHDALKFFDFYYVYPSLLKRLSKLPKPFCYHSKAISQIEDTFEVIPNYTNLFFEMSPLQEQAITSLIQKGLLSLDGQTVSLNVDLLPQELIDMFNNDSFGSSAVFNILKRCFPKVKLNGPNGFKARSGLMEYRYE